MDTPKNLSYSKTHEWVTEESGKTRVGLTDYAQDSLGELVFVNLPEVGDDITVGESFGDVESVKAVSDIYSPVSGKVAAINEQLLDAPEMINAEPYSAWLIEVEDVSEREELLDAAAYETFVAEENA